MNFKEILLNRFRGDTPGRPLFMPDLGPWFSWHSRRKTLPEDCRESSLADICSALNCPAWIVHTPWKLEYDGIEVTHEKSKTRRVFSYHTGSGVLSEVWDLGPDGDWWQQEYPVKKEDDLDAAEEIVNAMRYRLNYAELPEADSNSGIIEAVEVPKTPYSDMLHTFLGWSEGLMLMVSEEDRMTELLRVMDEKRRELVRTLAADLHHAVFLTPDNLDGQFISPSVFSAHLAPSYRNICETLHGRGKHLLVHIGGLSRRLLPLLAGTGIDCLTGISGPPQSDATLSEARKEAGPDITLWGGIPQDYVMPMHDRSVLIESVEEAMQFAETDPRTIIGIADHVPVDAEFGRIREICMLLNGR
ncbi:MAG TPA: uroporphyrinogen decarboxylase family protein [Acidobacteriota bacterium]|nr:uroporphyrinogen decarboxylase family protein [Acidobacteriota bacterium]